MSLLLSRCFRFSSLHVAGLGAMLFSPSFMICADGGSAPATPFLSSEKVWSQVQQEIKATPAALRQLAADAERYLHEKPINIVTGKKHLAPSGSPHDYISIGTYWWPDPAKPDGLPWIRKDGKVTPTFYEYDNVKMEALYEAVSKLILYSRVVNSPAHARQAGKLLRGWFLDEATRMNPHLRYAQFIPGVCEGRCIGLIDTMLLVFLLDSVTHLEFNEDWKPEHLAGLKNWVAQYLDWLRQSDLGKEEESQHNNHGTWYDIQIVAFAVFCGQPELARAQIVNQTEKRIDRQIAVDGRQPDELTRTLGLTYCTHNLLAYAGLAALARNLGVDLWHRTGNKGQSVETALQWLLPYYSQEKEWPFQQIKPFDVGSAIMVLSLAADSGLSVPSGLISQRQEYPWQRIIFQRPASRSGTQH